MKCVMLTLIYLKFKIMIRFLNLSNQICEGQKDFAFFDTITNTILNFDDEQVFTTKQEFENAYLYQNNSEDKYAKLQRFTSLIPDGF
jgi:hypothetical protein